MFDSLRDRFQTVQEGITASFRGLSASDPPRKFHASNAVNYNAGADLLHKYQTEWSELHKLSEENATKAQELDEAISSLHCQFEKHWTDVGQIGASLAGIPQLLSSVQQLMEQIGSLQELFEEVEGALFKLEDMVETQELQERQLDHRFQFALYKEKKLAELESVRSRLATEHAQKVFQHEAQQQQLLRERQDTFGQAFEQDVEHYKKCGKLPATSVPLRAVERGPSLEEVTLEPDDPQALDEFLDSDNDLTSPQE
ncbi:dysbindin [Anabrus simplex]|uniref:dysbindin n=1 Tax=Anabrus simplex TaxID=316456 RepID=UPI0035A3AB14